MMAHRSTSRSIHEPVLSVWQLWMQDVLASAVLRALLAMVISANLVCTVVQTDREAAGEEPLFGIAIVDRVILGLFTVELRARRPVGRSGLRSREAERISAKARSRVGSTGARPIDIRVDVDSRAT